MERFTLEVEGRPYELVAGLVWHPLQGSGSARSREILAFAGETDADLKLLRGDEAPHVGLARRSDGARAGHISAAAVIADALAQQGQRSALAAFCLPQAPQRYLYLAMRDQVILADGDTVGTEPQVRQRLAEDRAYGGWDCVLCPPEWGLPDAQHRTLESFFPAQLLKKPKRWQLQELRWNVTRAAAVTAAVAAVAVGTTWAWRHHQQRQEQHQAQANAMQQAAERAQRERSRAKTTAPVPPWPLLPRPVAFARACVDAFARTGTVAGNWKLDGAVCEAGQLTVRWIRTSEAAWVSHLQAVRPDAMVAADGLSAVVGTPAPALPADEHAEELQPLQPQRLRYLDLASRYGMQIRVEPVPPSAPPPQLPGQAAAPAPPPPPWSETSVQANVAFNPMEAARLLEAPGLRFGRLVFAFGKDGQPQYQFTGVHYARP